MMGDLVWGHVELLVPDHHVLHPDAVTGDSSVRPTQPLDDLDVLADHVGHRLAPASPANPVSGADRCGSLSSPGRIVDASSPFETHVGAAGVHLALTLPPSPFAQELSIFNVEPRGPRTGSSIPTDGDRILPRTAPGLGVTFA